MTIRQHLMATLGLFWIGGCAVALILQTRVISHLPIAPGWLDAFVLGSTVFGYHFAHRHRAYQTAAWLLGGLSGLCFFWLDRVTQFSALGPLLLWGAYYGLRWPGRAGLRRLPVAKPVVIALTWAWVTVWLPAQQFLWPFFVARAAFIFALALGYDLVDLAYDQRRQFVTLVNQIGPRHTYLLIINALILAAGSIGLLFAQNQLPLTVAAPIWATYLLAALTLLRIVHSTWPVVWQKAGIDALMVLQALVVWLVAR